MLKLTDRQLELVRKDAEEWQEKGIQTHPFAVEWVLMGLTELAELRRRDPQETRPPEWQPMESAPRDGTEIVGWSLKGGRAIYWFQSGSDAEDKANYSDVPPCWTTATDDAINGERSWHLDGAVNQPTHWQPLPEPPKQAVERTQDVPGGEG